MTTTDISVSRVQEALSASWSLKSSNRWRPDNPALGNCGVSALVAFDHLGGEILKTRFGDLWHFYNRIDGKRIDFTESQFEEPVRYDDVPSTPEEAFGDTNQEQYEYLGTAVREILNKPQTEESQAS